MSSPSSPSLRSAALVLAAALAALPGCAADDGEALPPPDSAQCQQSALTYQNFAAPFIITWCRGCHGAGLPVTMRQNAPAGVDFDTAEQVRTAQGRILARATGSAPTMPPAGGPSDEERALMAEWISCGMK